MSSRPQLIGVTGGIGSGKSTACKIFELLGRKVYYADDRAKWLMENDSTLIHEIKSLFGDLSYKEDKLDRKLIANKVFANGELLAKLNQKVHPVVASDLQQWVSENSNESVLFDEAALLFETGSYKKMDKNILVTAPQNVRMERVLKRDSHRTRESIIEIMDKQMSDEEKIPLADFIIRNDDHSSVIEQTMQVYHQLI